MICIFTKAAVVESITKLVSRAVLIVDAFHFVTPNANVGRAAKEAISALTERLVILDNAVSIWATSSAAARVNALEDPSTVSQACKVGCTVSV